jgi:isoleucyl-tRNA synthetase
VNKVLEKARTDKAIGSSLEAKLLLYVADPDLQKVLQTLNPTGADAALNHVDELRYLFLTSQVELLNTPEKLAQAQYRTQTETLEIGVAKADGEKCDRCWNYSVHVGESAAHPLLCERCVPAIAGDF